VCISISAQVRANNQSDRCHLLAKVLFRSGTGSLWCADRLMVCSCPIMVDWLPRYPFGVRETSTYSPRTYNEWRDLSCGGPRVREGLPCPYVPYPICSVRDEPPEATPAQKYLANYISDRDIYFSEKLGLVNCVSACGMVARARYSCHAFPAILFANRDSTGWRVPAIVRS